MLVLHSFLRLLSSSLLNSVLICSRLLSAYPLPTAAPKTQDTRESSSHKLTGNPIKDHMTGQHFGLTRRPRTIKGLPDVVWPAANSKVQAAAPRAKLPPHRAIFIVKMVILKMLIVKMVRKMVHNVRQLKARKILKLNFKLSHGFSFSSFLGD